MHQATALLAPASICDDSLLVFWGPRFFPRSFSRIVQEDLVVWSNRENRRKMREKERGAHRK